MEAKRRMIPLNRPAYAGNEALYVQETIEAGDFGERSKYTLLSEKWLKAALGRENVFLNMSCTHALEMTSLLLDIKPGDEVIVPSYTFVATATAFAMRGATLVFIDICEDTLCMDERLLEAAISPRTKAIVPVHYAGVACAMDEILAIAKRHNIAVVEDAAHGIGATYKNKPLGSMGDLGCLSFDLLKNLTAGGQGGALIINNKNYAARAEIIMYRGTNRRAFQRGEEPRYEWKDSGSLYTLNALGAAYLYGNMERADDIQTQRMQYWQGYYHAFEPLVKAGHVRLANIPKDCGHNAHIFYLKLQNLDERDRFIAHMSERGIGATFHYVPLHISQAGRQFGREGSALDVTLHTADTLVRLPLYFGLTRQEHAEVIEAVLAFWA